MGGRVVRLSRPVLRTKRLVRQTVCFARNVHAGSRPMEKDVDEPEVIELLSPPELAEKLQISKKTLAKWRCNGRGPRFVRLGHAIRYRTRDVSDWLDAKSSWNTAEASDRR